MKQERDRLSKKDGYLELRHAIVFQAYVDLKKVLLKYYQLCCERPITAKSLKSAVRLNNKKKEIEDFFHSDWYMALCSVDADYMMNLIEQKSRLVYKKRVRARAKRGRL